MHRTWELAMTGQYENSQQVLAQLEKENFPHLDHWRNARHSHRIIDQVCRKAVGALKQPYAHRPAHNSDSDAVWHVIETEIAGFWRRDFAKFAACFVQSPRFRFRAWSRSNGVTVRDGWDDFARGVQFDIICDPDPNPYLAYGATLENRNLTVIGDMAWCTFTADYKTLELDGFRGPGITHETRVLERHDGQWKSVLYSFESIDFGQTDAPLWEIDHKGAVLQQNPAAGVYLLQADDVMIRAGRLRMKDHAADRKLTESIAALAAIDYSFLTFRSALPVVVDAGYDLPRTVWWVIAEHGKLMVSYNDHPQLLARMAAAGKVFALSPAQTRLATALVEGLPLTDAARREQVSLGTAKTQLQRIFDKVGVRSQPGLVRQLLAITEKA